MRPYLSDQLKEKIRQEARNRCGYCLSPQHLVMARLEIEHIIPLAKGGANEEANLWLACPLCNGHKASQKEHIDPETNELTPLFNPRQQVWSDHFAWASGGLLIIGKTAVGRATVEALKLSSDPDALLVRSYWIEAGWHPPEI